MVSPTGEQATAFVRLFGSWGVSEAAPPPRPPALAQDDGVRADTGVTPRRALAAALLAADAEVLVAGDIDGIQGQIHEILAASQRRTLQELTASPITTDGGVLIDSMSAVFVCGVIDRVLGGGVLSRLANNSQPSDFVSTRALASLVVRLQSRKAA